MKENDEKGKDEGMLQASTEVNIVLHVFGLDELLFGAGGSCVDFYFLKCLIIVGFGLQSAMRTKARKCCHKLLVRPVFYSKQFPEIFHKTMTLIFFTILLDFSIPEGRCKLEN